MKHPLRSSVCTEGRRMAGARALWVAAGMKHEQFGKPIIAIVNSFTQFVPGHTHLHEIGQIVKKEIEAMGCYAAEFNTIAVDDGIAMGHDGMLYSLPSRDIIADSVEYMVNAHKADAMICISNCDKVTPGMLMASMRLNIPTVFCSGGPMEAGRWKGENADLITAMIKGADTSVSDEEMKQIEQCACPGCGSCSGMFTANSMNSLTEAIGLSLPGNGTILATHKNRIELFKAAARQVVKNAYAYYEDGDESVLPRNIATRDAFLNAMTLDIAMGGSTNTVLHLLAVAQEAGADFKMKDIDQLSRQVPCLCKLAPNTQKYSVQECNRAGGILGILMVAHFDFDEPLDEISVADKLNRLLPPDISIYRVCRVRPDAHARFDATARTYKYYVTTSKYPFNRQYRWRVYNQLDYALMNEAARTLFEYTDFTSFSKLHTDVKTNICHITHAEWTQEDDATWVFTIRADRFLRNMVRAIVGTLIEVGRGKLTVEGFRRVIEQQDRCKAGTSAPGQALFLVNVEYPESIFE